MKKIIIALALPMVLTSCATLFSGTKDRIVINTTPPGAKVYIDGVEVGESGKDIILERQFKNTREVKLVKEGYQELSFGIDQKIAGAYWFGILGLGGPMFYDILTGNAMKPRQNEFNKTLEKK